MPSSYGAGQLRSDGKTVTANRAAFQACLVMGLAFCAAAIGVYVFLLRGAAPFPRDGSGLVVGRDFLNLWMYGRAAFSAQPGLWYDPDAYRHALDALLGVGYAGQNWSYPPTIMLLAALFALLPYLPALLLWTLAGIAMFVLVLRRHAGGRVALAALVSPAAVFCVISGQSALFTSAALIAAFAWLDSRPLRAGLLLGLLMLKPQLGLLLPLILAVSGRWRVFAAAAATGTGLAFLSVMQFGAESWIRFITIGLPVQNIVLDDAGRIATPFFPTIFMNLHGAGLGYAAAMTVQAIFALAAAAAIGWAFRVHRHADPRLLFALFAACTIAALPYLLIYDTLPLTVAALMLLRAGALDQQGRVLARLVYWLPLLQIGMGHWHLPGPALIAAVFATHLVMVLRAGPENRRHSGAPGPDFSSL